MDKQKSADRQLSEIKSMFENNQALTYQVFDMMPIGICVTDENGLFTDVNKAYTQIYQYSREELIGNSFLMVVPKESQQELTQLHSQFMGKKYELTGRWTVQDKYKSSFDILTNAAYLRADNTEEPRKMTFVVKMEELEDTVDRLRHAVELLESKLRAQNLAERISQHEMRNKLGSIVTIANMLDKTDLDETQRKWLGLIKNAGVETLDMLDTTRDFAQMEQGNYTPDYAEFNVIELFKELQEELKTLKQSRNLKLVLNYSDKPVEQETSLIISADRKYIYHLFKNLVVNALEAAPPKSTVSLSVTIKESKDSFVTEIHNPGMIPKSIQKGFFQKYTTEGKAEGTGLGTYIAKMITEVHGGNITFVTHERDGTSIYVQLPISN